jgi:hypothetical protein
MWLWTSKLAPKRHVLKKIWSTVPLGQLRHKITPKIDAENFGKLLAFFAEYNINYFSRLLKSKKFLLLTRILLTM